MNAVRWGKLEGWSGMLRFISTILIAGVLAGHAAAREMPDVVRRYADAFAQSQGEAGQPLSKLSLRDEYATWFFEGFTNPIGGSFTRSTLLNSAYALGQAYWRDHPSERDEIFAGYGYIAVQREGVWSHGFEVNAFRPADSDEGEWWVTPICGDPRCDVGLRDARPGNKPRQMRIVGYLSPAGRYGHLGAYGRKVLVTSAKPVDEGHQLLTPCPFTDGCRYRQVPSWPSSSVLERLAPANRFSSR